MFKYKLIKRESDNCETLTILHKGVHSIGQGDLRFPYLKECIEKNKEVYPIDDILNFNIITPSYIKVEDNQFKFLDEVVEDDIILSNQNNLEIVQHLFFNLKNNPFDREKTLAIFKKQNDIEPLTKNCLLFVTETKGDYAGTPIFKVKNKEKVIKDYKNLNLSKSLKRNLESVLIKDGVFNENCLELLKKFKDWEPEFLNELLLHTDLKDKRLKGLKTFYNFYFKTPKRFLNVFKKQRTPVNLFANFLFLKEILAYQKISSLSELNKFYNKKVFEIKYQEKVRNLQANHPELKNILNHNKVLNYTLDFPKDHSEVQKWGSRMGNCFGGRATLFKNGRVCLFGLFENEKLKYVFEVLRNQKDVIGEFEGRGRKKPSRELKDNVIINLKKMGFNL